jgi:hypothetical protein
MDEQSASLWNLRIGWRTKTRSDDGRVHTTTLNHGNNLMQNTYTLDTTQGQRTPDLTTDQQILVFGIKSRVLIFAYNHSLKEEDPTTDQQILVFGIKSRVVILAYNHSLMK